MKVERLAVMFQPPQHTGSPLHCSRDSPAGATRERGKDKDVEKLGLCGLGPLMERCITLEAQHVYYTLLNKKVGLLHADKQKGKMYCVKPD